MTIDTNQFWNLLTESQLIGVQHMQTLFSEFNGDESIPKTAPALAKWMVEKKTVSPYQAQILLKGHKGPFRYGNYTVIELISEGVFQGHFLGRHTKTGFPVLMQFLKGEEEKDLQHWSSIEALVEKTSELKHSGLAESFEPVVLNDHRFAVSQFPNGKPFTEKLPRKARIPWQKACGIIAQAAYGLEQLHDANIVHNAISPRTIWIDKNGQAQLRLNPFPDLEFETLHKDPKIETQFDYRAPECFDGPNNGRENVSQASDIYALGCTLFRALAGQTPFPDLEFEDLKTRHKTSKPPSLRKLELPADLYTLIKQMLAKEPTDRPDSIGQVANLLALHSGQAKEIQAFKISNSATRKSYLDSISSFMPDSDRQSVAIPDLETDNQPLIHEAAAPAISMTDESFAPGSEERVSKIEKAARSAELRRKNRWKMPAAIAACLVLLAGVIGTGAYYANQKVVIIDDDVEKKKTETKTSTDPSNPKPAASAFDLENPPLVLQNLIEDDRKTLWETPTAGPPTSFSYLPLSPKIMFVLRPNDLVAHSEGNLILQSLGPDFSEKLKQLKNQSGLDLENIKHLLVSLHTNEAFEYEPYFIVETEKPIERERLIQLWNRPQLASLENGQDIYQSGDGKTAYYVLGDSTAGNSEATEPPADSEGEESKIESEPTEDEEKDEDDSQKAKTPQSRISRFAFGSKALVEEVALSAGANVLSGSLRKLADWTDNDRHINILFLKTALFNDEGQKLMGEKLGGFNRQLRLFFPDDVRGGLLSLHLDSGNYFEIMLDKNFDLKAPELKSMMVDELLAQRESLMQFAANIPPNPYWDRVRIRYVSMLNDFNRNLRWNIEDGEVVANCWLSPMAAHNLLAASELVVTFAGGSSATAVPAYSGPKTLEELLATKRDLNVANPPDLNVLMADLKTEIEEDIGKLPFAFNIRLIGGDLEAAGITKNQRPGELVMEQKTLAEILTSIMVSANPSKDISGPSDPNCKLIWVVAEDPDNPGQKAILVTTRDAATKKSYELPSAFQTE